MSDLRTDMPTPLLHIGYHKTATSWLQREVFGRRDFGFASFNRVKAAQALVNMPPLQFDPIKAREVFREWLETGERDALVPILSHERFSGYPHSGGYDSKELASRLAEVFPQARVLVIIREQSRMILSNYRQYVMDGGGNALRHYLEPDLEGVSRVPAFSYLFFEYHHLIRHYMALFGADNVRVLAYEQFRREPVSFVRAITDFAGVPPVSDEFIRDRTSVSVNPAMSGFGVALTRRVNLLLRANPLNPSPIVRLSRLARIIRGGVRKLDSGLPALFCAALERRAVKQIAQRTRGRYAESNRITSELIGADLALLGYELKS